MPKKPRWGSGIIERDGKLYHYDSRWYKESHAQQKAKQLRGRGYSARIVKRYNDILRQNTWWVFSRKR